MIAGVVQEAGGRLEGKTRLFKAYYLAHLLFWDEQEGTLTMEHQMVRMPNGPGIHDHDRILREMVRAGQIRASEERAGPYPKQVFESGEEIELSEEERCSIRGALDIIKDMTGTDASRFSHEVGKAWHAARDGERIDIYVDVIGDEKHRRNQRALDKAEVLLSDIFEQG